MPEGRVPHYPGQTLTADLTLAGILVLVSTGCECGLRIVQVPQAYRVQKAERL